MELYNFLWMNIKYLSLLLLVGQNTALVLTMRYSRIKHHGDKVYLASTVVFFTEILKFTICMLVISYNSKFQLLTLVNTLYDEIFRKSKETAKLCIPSIFYTIQNNLLFVALSHLDAATFQVTYQLKILTTALFSVLILHKNLTKQKWLALLVLACAVILVQWPSDGAGKQSLPGGAASPFLGFLAVLLACLSSGFTGVYIEKILKQSETSMWIRNIQLSLLSFFTSLFGVFVTDWSVISNDGLFQGYSLIVGMVILLQALGGITIAVVMKYADNILKGFATSLSIVLSSLISFFFLNDFMPSWFFLVGTGLVLCATFMYSQPISMPLLPATTTQTKKNSTSPE